MHREEITIDELNGTYNSTNLREERRKELIEDFHRNRRVLKKYIHLLKKSTKEEY